MEVDGTVTILSITFLYELFHFHVSESECPCGSNAATPVPKPSVFLFVAAAASPFSAGASPVARELLTQNLEHDGSSL